ncbi:MAG: LpqB family beta-propeller domain-containing protein, partial [Nocardioides sp.]
MRRPSRRPLVLIVALLALATTTSACIGMPEDGPVVRADVRARDDSQGPVVRQAQSPQEGDSRQNIVQGFLQAMRAYPVNLQVARRYLTTEEQDSWDPSRRIVTYATSDETGTKLIKVRLDGTRWIDSRGSWRGALGGGQLRLQFPVVKENDEWRISAAPNAFLVPDEWFESYYQRSSVFYFDPTASILVAEPVFVPVEQMVGGLVRALLSGPGPRLGDIVRSFVPTGPPSSPSVTVDDDNVVHVTLDPGVGRPSVDEATLMAAQFAWTLHEADVKRFTVSIGTQPLTVPGASSPFDVTDWPEFDPTDQQASPLLWGVRNGNLEVGDATAFQPVDGPFGNAGTIEDAAVSLTATYAAAVVDGGTTVVRGSVNDDQHPVVPVATEATRMLRPGWDSSDRLWMVDRTAFGA